jgi:hypothetical protein
MSEEPDQVGIGHNSSTGPAAVQSIAISNKPVILGYGGHPDLRLEEAEATIDRLKEFIESQISQGAWGGHALDAYMKEYKKALEGETK